MAYSRSQWSELLNTGGGLVDAEAMSEDADALCGHRLGVFELEDRIASGGMASVFRARRVDGQFDQHVAIKVLHAGLADEAHRQRFLQERQILARLDHPGIARVIDGGVTEDGRPYLVMDLVDGMPLDDWCHRFAPDFADRLALFSAVADAVQFAHGQLVVHCDLKPANILIDARHQPRLLDFGIAQVFASGLDDEAADSGFRPFTPLFAAPEQLRGEDARVATDIWQLGLLLYGLMTDAHPFRRFAQDLTRLSQEILEGRPGTPSDAGGSVAVPGHCWVDIDAIVGRCLARDAESRYLTVQELAADVQAMVDKRPVTATGGGAGYRAGRFLRRHRSATAITAVASVLVLGMGLWGQLRVDEERDRAAAMAALFSGISAVSDPLAGNFVGEELISASGFEFSNARRLDPVIQREFVLLSGQTWINLGHFDQIVQRVSPLIESIPEETQDSRRGDYLSLVGYARFRQGDRAGGRADLVQAMEHLADRDPAAYLLAGRRLAQLERADGNPVEARRVLESTLRTPGTGREWVAAWTDLGVIAGEQGAYQVAADAFRQAADQAEHGPARVKALAARADAERLAGRLRSAMEIADQSVQLAGDDVAMRSIALAARGNAYFDRGDLSLARDDYQAALGASRSSRGPDHSETGQLAGALAVTLAREGRCQAAVSHFDDGIRIARQVGDAQRVQDLQRERDACAVNN